MNEAQAERVGRRKKPDCAPRLNPHIRAVLLFRTGDRPNTYLGDIGTNRRKEMLLLLPDNPACRDVADCLLVCRHPSCEKVFYAHNRQ